MRANWIGTAILIGTSLVAGMYLSQMREEALGQPGGYPPHVVVNQPSEPPKWIVDIAPLDDPANPMRKLRAITVVDTETKKIAVYHEEMATGKVFWLSTRDIQPDLMVNQYNATSPLPSELGKEIQRLKNQNK